jgi:predicted ribonuclease YlaK
MLLLVLDTCVIIKLDTKYFKNVASVIAIPTMSKYELLWRERTALVNELSLITGLSQLTPDGRLVPFHHFESSAYLPSDRKKVPLLGHDEAILNACMNLLKRGPSDLSILLITDDVNMRLKGRCFGVEARSSRHFLKMIATTDPR